MGQTRTHGDGSRCPPGWAGWADRAWFGRRGRWLRGAAVEVLDAALPGGCLWCGAPGPTLCRECSLPLGRSLMAPAVVDDLSGLDVLAPVRAAPVVSGGRYGGILAAAILAAKRPQGLPLLRRLAPGLARSLRVAAGALGRGDGRVLVPVPASAGSMRRRGFAPVAELLAAAGPTPWPVIPALKARGRLARAAELVAGGGPGGVGPAGPRELRAVLGRGAQKGRGRRDRAAAVRGSFRLAEGARVRGRRVVLVDDVMTSGATLAECARVLRAAGSRVDGAVVLAHVADPHAESRAEAPGGGRGDAPGPRGTPR